MNLFLTNTQVSASQNINRWITGELLWCLYQLFGLSFSRHPFTADVQCYISSNLFWWRNKLIYILECLRVSKCSANVNFGVNYSIKSKSKADLCNNVENLISTALYLLVYEKQAMFL